MSSLLHYWKFKWKVSIAALTHLLSSADSLFMFETILFGCHFETNDRGSKTSFNWKLYCNCLRKRALNLFCTATFSADNLSAHMIDGFQVPLRHYKLFWCDQVYAPRHHAQYVRGSSSTDNEAGHL